MIVDTSWTIETDSGTYTADGLTTDNGWPSFSVGENVNFSFVFNEGDHVPEYKGLVQYGEFIFDGAIQTGLDYREEPYYKINGHEKFTDNNDRFGSYLMKITPADRIRNTQSWWVVVTEVEDATLYEGSWERINFSGFVVAPGSEGDKTYIEYTYEVGE